MTTNYQRGRRAEYECVDDLAGLGFDADRTAGSHGEFDVIGVQRGTMRVMLIQVKSGKRALADARKAHAHIAEQGFFTTPGVTVQVWARLNARASGKKWEVYNA